MSIAVAVGQLLRNEEEPTKKSKKVFGFKQVLFGGDGIGWLTSAMFAYVKLRHSSINDQGIRIRVPSGFIIYVLCFLEVYLFPIGSVFCHGFYPLPFASTDSKFVTLSSARRFKKQHPCPMTYLHHPKTKHTF